MRAHLGNRHIRFILYVLWLLPAVTNGLQNLHSSSSRNIAATKLKKAPYHGGRSNIELLSWAVKLSLPIDNYNKRQLDAIADMVAAKMGVHSQGQIGSLRGHYLFSHKLHNLSNNVNESDWKTTNEDPGIEFLQYVSKNDTGGAISRDEFGEIKKAVHRLMDQHEHVEWFTPQTVRSRQKRSFIPKYEQGENSMIKKTRKIENIIPLQTDVNGAYQTYINGAKKSEHSFLKTHRRIKFSDSKMKTHKRVNHAYNDLKNRRVPSNGKKGWLHLPVSDLLPNVRRGGIIATHNASRMPRDLTFPDPAFPSQWHLYNAFDRTMDINVTGVWEKNIRGHGVTVCVIDDGLQWTSEDLRDNYSPEGSWDLNGNDADPMPDPHKDKNHHGTRCAGEIAAVTNDYCAVGVAYEAKIAGIRMLDGPMTDTMEASAFTTGININDVYSCSWGPDDDGKTVDGPHYLAMEAMRHGVTYGRHGYGSIYVVASGNGGRFSDNCNFDGYANSIYTITIGAVDETGNMPFYAEECASMVAVTFSSGDGYHRSIVTTDWNMDGSTGCTSGHTGTSAAAPLAAGMVALALQVRPCLTWRDIQYLIIMTAVKVDRDEGHWHKNQAGLLHSHRHGFGLMNAWSLTNAAKSWNPVPWMTVFSSGDIYVQRNIPKSGDSLTATFPVDITTLEGYWLETLEHVQVTLTLEHPRRGDIDIRLTCPSGTESYLATRRNLDRSSEGFKDWTFSTVRCWGEQPHGNWTLVVRDKGTYGTGIMVKWHLRLNGSPLTVEEFAERKGSVEDAIRDVHLDRNISVPCAEPVLETPLLVPVSEKTLKIIALVSIFCLVLACYESMEYAFCYDEEKEEYRRMLLLQMRANRLMARRAEADTENTDAEEATETTRLLGAEEIPMQTFSRSVSQEGATGASAVAESTPLLQNGDLPDSLAQYQEISGNSDIPEEILNTLSPDEIRLNMTLGK